MNSITVYALGFELDNALAGSAVLGFKRYRGGSTFALKGSPVPYLHIIHYRREADLIISKEDLAPGESSIDALSMIRGTRISGVSSIGLDRILLFTLESTGGWGEKREFTLRVDMTPAFKPLALFQGRENRLVDSFGSPRSRRPSFPGEAPRAKPLSLLSLPENPPDDLIQSTEADHPVRTTGPTHTHDNAAGSTHSWKDIKQSAALLVESVGGLDPLLARSLSREGEGNIGKIWPKLIQIGRDLGEKNFNWSIYEFPGEGDAGSCALYPIRLPSAARRTEYSDFAEALAVRGDAVVLPSYLEYLRNAVIAGARARLERARRLKNRLSEDLAEAGRSKEYRHYGNLLATHRHQIKSGMNEISVRDFSGDRTLRIPLNTSLSPDANIRSYFKKARKGEKGALVIKNRRRAVADKIDETKRFIDSIGLLRKPCEILKLLEVRGEHDRSKRDSGGVRRFRRFVLDSHHTVYVGRNARENDELTYRFAAPGDIWFHAQGVHGSHVILSGAGPSTPRKILEIAAAIAAYFSKGRHSSTVPVIYTERRYVRKPRKSHPGTAAYQRGKTLFVTPTLPDDKGHGDDKDQKRKEPRN